MSPSDAIEALKKIVEHLKRVEWSPGLRDPNITVEMAPREVLRLAGLQKSTEQCRLVYQQAAYDMEVAFKWMAQRVPAGAWIMPPEVREIVLKYPEFSKRFGFLGVAGAGQSQSNIEDLLYEALAALVGEIGSGTVGGIRLPDVNNCSHLETVVVPRVDEAGKPAGQVEFRVDEPKAPRRRGRPYGRARKITPHLTDMEVEVARAIAYEKTNKLTASDLGISLKTVEHHRTNIYRATGSVTAIGVARWLLRNNLLELDAWLNGHPVRGAPVAVVAVHKELASPGLVAQAKNLFMD